MTMKLVSTAVALFLSIAAFITPSYAQEVEEVEETREPVIIGEVEFVTVPLIPENEPEAVATNETTANAGVINTPQGAGALLEDVCANEVNRQFITVQSRGGNVFYIIIDHDRNGQNVYFLNAVDDFDLLPFSDNFPDGVWEAYEELKEEAANNAIAAEIEGTEGEGGDGISTKNSTPETPTGGGNMQTMILVGIGVAFAGGFAYFKFFKGKKKAVAEPNFEEEDEDDYEEHEMDIDKEIAENEQEDE